MAQEEQALPTDQIPGEQAPTAETVETVETAVPQQQVGKTAQPVNVPSFDEYLANQDKYLAQVAAAKAKREGVAEAPAEGGTDTILGANATGEIPGAQAPAANQQAPAAQEGPVAEENQQAPAAGALV